MANRRSGTHTHTHTVPAYQSARWQIACQEHTHTHTLFLPTRLPDGESPVRNRHMPTRLPDGESPVRNTHTHTHTHSSCLPDCQMANCRSGTHTHTVPAYQTARWRIAGQEHTHTHCSCLPDCQMANRRSGTHTHTVPAYQTARWRIAGQNLLWLETSGANWLRNSLGHLAMETSWYEINFLINCEEIS